MHWLDLTTSWFGIVPYQTAHSLSVVSGIAADLGAI
jgi:hypothetical protein